MNLSNTIRALFFAAFGALVLAVLVWDIVRVFENPPVTVVQFLIICASVTAAALLARACAGSEEPTSDEKPFRTPHLGGIEEHFYSDGTRLVYCDGELVHADWPTGECSVNPE